MVGQYVPTQRMFAGRKRSNYQYKQLLCFALATAALGIILPKSHAFSSLPRQDKRRDFLGQLLTTGTASLPQAVLARNDQRLALGLGTSGIGDAALLLLAIRLGFRLLDTAAFYRNEEVVGKAVAQATSSGEVAREAINVTTKVWWADMGSAGTLRSVSSSLKRLGTEADLALIHWPGRWLTGDAVSNQRARAETWKTLERLKMEGAVKEIGVSNYTLRHLREMETYASEPPAVNQIELHPYCQQKSLVEYCKVHEVSVQAYSPLASGKMNLLRDPTISDIAKECRSTPAQVVLKWLLQSGVTPIVKSTSVNRMQENLEASRMRELSPDQVLRIASLDRSAPCDFTGLTNPDRIA